MTTKNQNKKLIKDLERLFRKEKTLFPIKIKNTIYVGYYGVNQQANKLYKVFSVKERTTLHTTFTKSAAIALAKLYATNYYSTTKNKILELDCEYSKYYIDSLFYKNTLENSKDYNAKELAEIRLDIAEQKIETLNSKLNLMVLRNY